MATKRRVKRIVQRVKQLTGSTSLSKKLQADRRKQVASAVRGMRRRFRT